MGLSLALNNARASLGATSSQIAAASRNTTGSSMNSSAMLTLVLDVRK